MKFDSKVKGALAWTGLFVILAVPSADLLFGKDQAPAANLAVTSDTAQLKPVVPAAKPELKLDPVETASVSTPAARTDDAVETYLEKGKKLPAYISDADSAPVVKPATPVTVTKPVDVAVINPVQVTPPMPLPRNARPVAKAPVVASVPATPSTQPLIIDETDLNDRQANLNQPTAPLEPFPLSDGDQAFADDETVVTGDQLEEWDSGSLADYLARQGLLNEDSEKQSAQDDSDFVFNEGPSRPRRPLNDFFLF
ncbi:MAG: hypothetical protein Q8M47_10440 [Devosia sp.]|nr:hypothetical protein [Devosia sp.]